MLVVREFLRLVLDPLRLAILGRATEGPIDVEYIASTHNRPVRDVQEAVGRLRAAGLLDSDLELDRGALREIAASLPHSPPADPSVLASGTWSQEESDILSRFVSGSRLMEIPAGRGKRVVILERLAQEFEPGVRYEEAEVNFTLQLWHPDYAALRRYLVDEGLMTRADGVYWRTGGRFEPDGASS